MDTARRAIQYFLKEIFSWKKNYKCLNRNGVRIEHRVNHRRYITHVSICRKNWYIRVYSRRRKSQKFNYKELRWLHRIQCISLLLYKMNFFSLKSRNRPHLWDTVHIFFILYVSYVLTFHNFEVAYFSSRAVVHCHESW